MVKAGGGGRGAMRGERGSREEKQTPSSAMWEPGTREMSSITERELSISLPLCGIQS